MSTHVSRRLFVVAAVLGAVAVFAAAFFVALGVRSVVAGPDSAPAAQEPPVSHTYDQIELPPGTWPGLDADTVDGMHTGQSGTDYIPYADASGNVGIGTTSPGTNKLKVQGDTQITGALNIAEGAIQDGRIVGADIIDGTITRSKLNYTRVYHAVTTYESTSVWVVVDSRSISDLPAYYTASVTCTGSHESIKQLCRGKYLTWTLGSYLHGDYITLDTILFISVPGGAIGEVAVDVIRVY